MKKLLASAAFAALAVAASAPAYAASQGLTVGGVNTAQCTWSGNIASNLDLGPTLFDANGMATVINKPGLAVGTISCNVVGAAYGVRSSNGALTHNGTPWVSGNPKVDYTTSVQVTNNTNGAIGYNTATYGGPGYASAAGNLSHQASVDPVTMDVVTIAGTATLPAGTYQDTIVVWVGNP